MEPFPLPDDTTLKMIWPVCLICLTVASLCGSQLCRYIEDDEKKSINESRFYAIRDILTESQKELKRIRKAVERPTSQTLPGEEEEH